MTGCGGGLAERREFITTRCRRKTGLADSANGTRSQKSISIELRQKLVDLQMKRKQTLEAHARRLRRGERSLVTHEFVLADLEMRMISYGGQKESVLDTTVGSKTFASRKSTDLTQIVVESGLLSNADR